MVDVTKLSDLIVGTFSKPKEPGKGLIGYEENGVYKLQPSGSRTKIYVRVTSDGSQTVVKAINVNCPLLPDYPVNLYNLNRDVYATVDIDRIIAYITTSGMPINITAVHTHEPGGGNFDPVSTIRIRAGLVYSKGGLLVGVEGKHYIDMDGAIQWFPPVSVLDVSGYLAVTPGNHHLALLAIDRRNGTLAVLEGTETSEFISLGHQALVEFDLFYYDPLMALDLREGATSLVYADFIDARLWAASGTLGVADRKHNLSATVNPAITDDSVDGYSIGSLWFNLTTDQVYVATDVTVGASVWKLLTVTSIDHLSDVDNTGAIAGDVLIWDGTTYSPAPPSGGTVVSIVAGTGIAVDATDPANPIVSSFMVTRWEPLIYDDDIVIYDHDIVMVEVVI